MARKILVSLVSDQTIPNVLLARELNDIEFYIFVSTKKMEEKNRSNHTIEALELKDNQYQKIIVQEDSLTDIDEKLKKECKNSDSTYFVNLTGGTKIMSIGLFNYFKELDSTIYYMPGGKNIYRQIYPEIENKENIINYRTSLKEYLMSYGISISKKSYNRKNDLLKSNEYTKKFMEKYLSNDIDINFLDELRKIRNIKQLNISDLEGLSDFLQNCEFKTSLEGILEKKETEYLTGGWFEEYVYLQITSELNFDDKSDMIGINILISNQNIQNEFDVMYVHENKLTVIECKTGIYDSITQRNITNEAIYKLAALKKDFGLFAQSEFYTLSEKGDTIESLKPIYYERAKILGIKFIDRNNILNN